MICILEVKKMICILKYNLVKQSRGFLVPGGGGGGGAVGGGGKRGRETHIKVDENS